MDVIKRLSPGQPGTKRHQQPFGDRLLFVRYRHDTQTRRRLTTVELIVDEAPLPVPNPIAKRLYPRPNQLVPIHIAYDETELRTKVKAAGGKWNARARLWTLPYRRRGTPTHRPHQGKTRCRLVDISIHLGELMSRYRNVPGIGKSV